jgi:pantetheine-phosphate adenylyltransferase
MDAKRTVVFGGTFDPFTLGHLRIVEQALSFADEIVIAVCENSQKRPKLSADERVELIRRAVTPLSSVRVEKCVGLLTAFCKAESIRVAVRGIRSAAHFEEEQVMSEINRRLYPELVTIMIPTAPELAHVSSSAVREIARYGGDLHGWVPVEILEDIAEAYLD